MKLNLTELEIRVLGCLMEKELTTPENYPLSVNALLSACNQKSNRDPVLNLVEKDLLQGLAGLGTKGLARRTATGGRVDKYCHSVGDKLGLAPAVRAVLCELMLRGPQTPGELRNRAERMVELPEPGSIEEILLELQQFGPPLVTRLPRQPGRKEARYAQLFGGMPELPEYEAATEKEEVAERPQTVSRKERILKLQQELGELGSEMMELRREVQELIASFS